MKGKFQAFHQLCFIFLKTHENALFGVGVNTGSNGGHPASTFLAVFVLGTSMGFLFGRTPTE